MALATITASCKKKVEGTKAKVGEATGKAATATAAAATYTVNAADSNVRWTGSKAIGDKHAGKINLSGGDLKVDGGKLVSGSFTLDMNSIKSDENLAKLEGHLKSADFFDVATHGTAKFVITKVTEKANNDKEMTHTITGDLTIKGISKSIEFDANVSMVSDMLMATSDNFVINRTDWDVKYGSGLINAAKDQIINDDVAITISIKAKK